MSPTLSLQTRPLSRMDQWICSRLHSTVLQCEQAFQSYELHLVTSCLYSFWLHCLCDVYLVGRHLDVVSLLLSALLHQ